MTFRSIPAQALLATFALVAPFTAGGAAGEVQHDLTVPEGSTFAVDRALTLGDLTVLGTLRVDVTGDWVIRAVNVHVGPQGIIQTLDSADGAAGGSVLIFANSITVDAGGAIVAGAGGAGGDVSSVGLVRGGDGGAGGSVALHAPAVRIDGVLAPGAGGAGGDAVQILVGVAPLPGAAAIGGDGGDAGTALVNGEPWVPRIAPLPCVTLPNALPNAQICPDGATGLGPGGPGGNAFMSVSTPDGFSPPCFPVTPLLGETGSSANSATALARGGNGGHSILLGTGGNGGHATATARAGSGGDGCPGVVAGGAGGHGGNAAAVAVAGSGGRGGLSGGHGGHGGLAWAESYGGDGGNAGAGGTMGGAGGHGGSTAALATAGNGGKAPNNAFTYVGGTGGRANATALSGHGGRGGNGGTAAGNGGNGGLIAMATAKGGDGGHGANGASGGAGITRLGGAGDEPYGGDAGSGALSKGGDGGNWASTAKSGNGGDACKTTNPTPGAAGAVFAGTPADTTPNGGTPNGQPGTGVATPVSGSPGTVNGPGCNAVPP